MVLLIFEPAFLAVVNRLVQFPENLRFAAIIHTSRIVDVGHRHSCLLSNADPQKLADLLTVLGVAQRKYARLLAQFLLWRDPVPRCASAMTNWLRKRTAAPDT